MFQSKVIDRVEIILENCEVITIPNDNIDFLAIDKVYEYWRKLNEANVCITPPTLDKHYYCGLFTIYINESANIIDNMSWKDIENCSLPFERLTKWNDITSVDIFYIDGTKDNIHMPYSDPTIEGSIGEENRYQHSEMYDEHWWESKGLMIEIKEPA